MKSDFGKHHPRLLRAPPGVLATEISSPLGLTVDISRLLSSDRFDGSSPPSMTLTLAVSRFSGPAKPVSRCRHFRGTSCLMRRIPFASTELIVVIQKTMIACRRQTAPMSGSAG